MSKTILCGKTYRCCSFLIWYHSDIQQFSSMCLSSYVPALYCEMVTEPSSSARLWGNITSQSLGLDLGSSEVCLPVEICCLLLLL